MYVLLAILSSLEDRVEQAGRERAAAEARERAASQALEQARADAAEHVHRRAELAGRLEAAAIQAEAACGRLGEARASAASSAREVAALADSVAEGGADMKALLRVQDLAATQLAIAEAHQRRAATAEAARVAAEKALNDHDAAEVERVGRQLEQLLLAEARGVDQLLEAVSERTAEVFATFDRRRRMLPKEAWPIDITHSSNRFGVLLAAFQRATWGVNHTSIAVGHTTAKSFMTYALSAVQSWQRGRGELEPQPDQAA